MKLNAVSEETRAVTERGLLPCQHFDRTICDLTLYSIDTHFQQQTSFENIVRKGKIAHNEQFLLFPQCFQLNWITVSPHVHIFDILSLFAVELEEPKIGISGKRLTRV